ncbi:unnamed protein product, partial [Strongylus vulgaris]
LGTGRFGYIKLAEHKQSKQKIAIKQVDFAREYNYSFFLSPHPQIIDTYEGMHQVDFVREYNYSFFLSPHPQIIDTYEGMYQTGDDSAYFFVQEFCPRASVREAVEATNQQGSLFLTYKLCAMMIRLSVHHSVTSAFPMRFGKHHRGLTAQLAFFQEKQNLFMSLPSLGRFREKNKAIAIYSHSYTDKCNHASEQTTIRKFLFEQMKGHHVIVLKLRRSEGNR